MSAFDDMMRTAQTALGTKYVWGGNSLSGGVDCSGFTQQVFRSVGIELPRVSNQQAASGSAVGRDQAKAGDLVWWDLNGRNKGADHIGIYLGNGMVMEASSSQGKVVVRQLWGNAQFTRVDGGTTGGAVNMPAGGGGNPSVANTPAAARAQTGLDPMASLSSGGALGLGDLRGEAVKQEDSPGSRAPQFDLESLYAAMDPDDLGEDEDTVGPYNVARLMAERFNSGRDTQPTPAPGRDVRRFNSGRDLR